MPQNTSNHIKIIPSPIKCASCETVLGITYATRPDTSRDIVYCYYCANSIAAFTDLIKSITMPTPYEIEHVFFDNKNTLNRVIWNHTLRHLNAYGYQIPEKIEND